MSQTLPSYLKQMLTWRDLQVIRSDDQRNSPQARCEILIVLRMSCHSTA